MVFVLGHMPRRTLERKTERRVEMSSAVTFIRLTATLCAAVAATSFDMLRCALILWNLIHTCIHAWTHTYYIILYYTLYTIHYTLYTIHYTLYTILYTIYYILYTIYYILYTIYYILYTIPYYTVLYCGALQLGNPEGPCFVTTTHVYVSRSM